VSKKAEATRPAARPRPVMEALREQTLDDLRAKAKELDDQAFRLRLQKAMGQLESPIKVRTTRRELARIKTVIRQKEQG
jgi:large subunit ribosomal protein L29